MAKDSEWIPVTIDDLQLKYAESYHPIAYKQVMEVKRGFGWAPVLYLYVLDDYVGVWVEPLMGHRAVKVDKTTKSIKLRVRPIREGEPNVSK